MPAEASTSPCSVTSALTFASTIALPQRYGDWSSADLHVHMNYGGHYRNDSTGLAAMARDLSPVRCSTSGGGSNVDRS